MKETLTPSDSATKAVEGWIRDNLRPTVTVRKALGGAGFLKAVAQAVTGAYVDQATFIELMTAAGYDARVNQTGGVFFKAAPRTGRRSDWTKLPVV